MSSFEPELLKQKYEGAIRSLYSGTQCAQCGNRFNQQLDGVAPNGQQHEQQQNRYRKHLDWHFRQNKREKEEVNKAHMRTWFYSLAEWVVYEEIREDVEQQQFAASQQQQQQAVLGERGIAYEDMDIPEEHANGSDAKAGNENGDGPTRNSISSMVSNLLGRQLSSYLYNGGTPTCPATEDIGDSCCICNDPFEIFWYAEKDEWHFKDAVRIENKIYHPICLEDASDVSQL